MSLTRRLTTWHGGSHWSAGPARPPAGATGLPCRRLVAPYHTPDHATCLSRRPAAPPRYPHKAPVCHATRASMALYAQATRLSCYAPCLTLRSPVLACCHVFSLSQIRGGALWAVDHPTLGPTQPSPIGSVRTRSVAQDLLAAAVSSSPIVFFAFLLFAWCVVQSWPRGVLG
jgi:hypothetical protein